MDEASGDGWAELQKDGSLEGEIRFHSGAASEAHKNCRRTVLKPWRPLKITCLKGGAGFVGSSLALTFKRNRSTATVIVLDNLKRRIERLSASGVKLAHGDVRLSDDLAAIGPVDLLVEASAEPSAARGAGMAQGARHGVFRRWEWPGGRDRGRRRGYLANARRPSMPVAQNAELLMIGAYPPSGKFDFRRGSKVEHVKTLASIPQVPLPAFDPVFRAKGPLVALWRT